MSIAVDVRADAALVPLHRRHRGSVAIWLCLVFIAAVVVCAIFGASIAPHDPSAQNLLHSGAGPSGTYLFGTDQIGRDIFSRVIVGARTALIGPAVIALGSLLIGGTLGLVAGYMGGRVDWLIMRWVDLMYALPALLVAIVVVGALGGGYVRAVILLTLLSAPYDTRVIRGATLEQRPLPYVEAAKLLGLSRGRIMFRQIVPNITPIIVANSFLNFAFNIVNLAALSYLGLGVDPGTADWGRMLADNQNLLTQNAAAVLGPALALVLTAASVNILGDRLYERLADRGRAR
jgi:peptide/nickel transport system permease protein